MKGDFWGGLEDKSSSLVITQTTIIKQHHDNDIALHCFKLLQLFKTLVNNTYSGASHYIK